MNKNDILDYVTETPRNTNRAVLGSMLNQLSSSSEGDGDFSTATVTISNNLGNLAVFVGGIIDNDEIQQIVQVSNGTQETITAILYKNVGKIVEINGGGAYATVTGDIIIEQDTSCTITGNGTITLG